MKNDVLERFVGPVESVTKYVTKLRDGGMFFSPEQRSENVLLAARAKTVLQCTINSVARQIISNVIIEYDRELQETHASFRGLSAYQRGLIQDEVMVLCYLKGARAMQDQLIAESKINDPRR